MRDTRIDIECLGGNCPVQAEGSCLEGHRFYFRARGDQLQMTITREKTGEHPLTWWPNPDAVWYYSQRYGGGYAAGWVGEDVAGRFIAWAVDKFEMDVLKRPEWEESHRAGAGHVPEARAPDRR